LLYLLDTTAFSDLMRELPQLDDRLARLSPDDRIAVCTITRGEIGYGIVRLPEGKRRRELEAKAVRLLAALPCEPIPPAAGDCYANIKLTQQRAGLPLDENDLWIAATAMAIGATLVSRDADFARIDGLAYADWSAP